jgi:hypothetical protein
MSMSMRFQPKSLALIDYALGPKKTGPGASLAACLAMTLKRYWAALLLVAFLGPADPASRLSCGVEDSYGNCAT